MTSNKKLKPVEIYFPDPHPKQREIDENPAKFKLVRAGRRGGKTTHGSRKAAKKFLEGRRQMLASPSLNQVDAFWEKLNVYFYDAIEAGAIIANKSRRIITFPGNKPGRIECRTARDANELRGGWADDVYLDEFAYLKNAEYGLHEVIEPMLLDTNGNLEIYSSPRAGSYFNELDEKIDNGLLDEWANFAFTSHDNPHLSKEALERQKRNAIARGGVRAYEQEILAMRLGEVTGALWRQAWFRYDPPTSKGFRFVRVVVAVDPAVSSNSDSDETGIVVVAKGSNGLYYVLADLSGVYTPLEWAQKVAWAYEFYKADRVVAEKNQGGDLVKENLKTSGGRNFPVWLVHASRGKVARAEPIAALYQPDPQGGEFALGRVVHCPGLYIDDRGKLSILPGSPDLKALENQMTTWTVDADFSPDRSDAAVWGLWFLSQKSTGAISH